MKTLVAIVSASLALASLGESLVDKMRNSYDAAVAAKERLDSVMQDVDIDAKVQEIQKEVDRLEEEHYRIMQDSDAAKQKSETALASFSALDFAAIDTSQIDSLKSEIDEEVGFYDQSYSELMSAAEIVISYVKDITAAPDWASWEWIIEHFGGGWDMIPPSIQSEIRSKASYCTVENCECMSDLYFSKDYGESIHNMSVFHLRILLEQNGWIDKTKEQIP